MPASELSTLQISLTTAYSNNALTSDIMQARAQRGSRFGHARAQPPSPPQGSSTGCGPACTVGAQVTFLAESWWNLCFSSNFTGSPQSLCWYAAPQTFAAITETGTLTLNVSVPDADWQLVLNAPYGAITGSLTLFSANGTTADLAAWTFCVPRDSQPLPGGGSTAASSSVVSAPPSPSPPAPFAPAPPPSPPAPPRTARPPTMPPTKPPSSG